jgi:hypothetical protein
MSEAPDERLAFGFGAERDGIVCERVSLHAASFLRPITGV